MASTPKASFSIPSILAVVAAIFSFTQNPFIGLILAVTAILLGVVGIILSLSPSIRGGITSTISIVAGLIGIVAAIIKTLIWIF